MSLIAFSVIKITSDHNPVKSNHKKTQDIHRPSISTKAPNLTKKTRTVSDACNKQVEEPQAVDTLPTTDPIADTHSSKFTAQTANNVRHVVKCGECLNPRVAVWYTL